MSINIENLTKNLSEYSQEANNASTAIAKGLLPVGIVILGIFFLVEFGNWKNILNKNGRTLNSTLWAEFAVKYIIGIVLILTSGYILDAIMEISIAITNKVNSIYPPNSYSFIYEKGELDGYFLNLLMNTVGWILEKVSQTIIYILIFIRYIDLYFLKALSPIMIGFYYSDEFRPIVMNFFKTFIAYSLLGVVLLILTIIFNMVITNDLIKSTTKDSEWITFLSIIKGIVYILVIMGSVRKIKSLVGVQ